MNASPLSERSDLLNYRFDSVTRLLVRKHSLHTAFQGLAVFFPLTSWAEGL